MPIFKTSNLLIIWFMNLKKPSDPPFPLNAGLFQMKNLGESHPSSKTPSTLEQHQDSFLPQLSWSSDRQAGEEGARTRENGGFCQFSSKIQTWVISLAAILYINFFYRILNHAYSCTLWRTTWGRRIMWGTPARSRSWRRGRRLITSSSSGRGSWESLVEEWLVT